MRCVGAPIQPPHMLISFSTQKVERGFMALIIVVLILLQSTACHSQPNINNPCTSSCGNLRNIGNPFRVKGDPEKCGDKRGEIACENNVATMSVGSGRYYVQAINYSDVTVRLVDPGVEPNNCSSTPLYFLGELNFTYDYAWDYQSSLEVVYLTCAEPVNDPLYVSTAPCTGEHHQGAAYSYAVVVEYLYAKDIRVGCQVKLVVLTDWEDWGLNNSYADIQRLNYSYADIHRHLVHGFELSWSGSSCEYYDEVTFHKCGIWRTLRAYLLAAIYYLLDWPSRHIPNRFLYVHYFLIPFASGLEVAAVVLHAVKVTLGAPCVIILLFRKWRKRHLSMYDSIEEFLQSNSSLMPIRYSYKEIRNMTEGFKDKLGEGGFGTVFKGKLRSRSLVAVKMLSNSKANGQDFMSEIGTIGRIHHVNVVRLIGYCVEGSKCALVYEFMSNGSLDKYIFFEEEGVALSLKKIYEISIGVARGIAYLHQGCDMQILHFDVKPHNILLDENFTPKVSDFGLAKLYPIDESIVPLTAARGTIGYMAPELFYKNIGGVSDKADVYSFGMLLLEMAGRRKKLNPYAENSSQIYFPSWVYDQFIRGNEIMEITDANEEERKLVKKMIIVAFWCIQMKPSIRPTMKKVVEMLESEVEGLQTPPKPFVSVLDLPSNNASSSSHTKPANPSSNSVGSLELESNSLILNATHNEKSEKDFL